LLAHPEWSVIVRELMMEVIRAGRALGHTLEDALVETQIQRTLTMGAYKPSTVLDFETGLALELQTLFLEPLRQARAAGVETPRLASLCRVLTTLSNG
jgi:2-dehydropantoate 2-reductase